MANEVNRDWILPSFPDRLPVRRRQQPTGSAPLNLSPIPRPTPPTDFSLQPIYPDRIVRRRLSVAAQAGMVLPLGGLTLYQPLGWLPSYPARVSRRSLSVAHMPTTPPFTIGAILAVPTFPSWRALAPAWIARRRQTPTISGGVMLLVAPPSQTICIELHNEALVNPRFTTETLVSAQFLSEGLTLPQLTTEAVC